MSTWRDVTATNPCGTIVEKTVVIITLPNAVCSTKWSPATVVQSVTSPAPWLPAKPSSPLLDIYGVEVEAELIVPVLRIGRSVFHSVSEPAWNSHLSERANSNFS